MILDHNDRQTYPKCFTFMTKMEGDLQKQPDILNAYYTLCKADTQPTPDKIVVQIAREKALRYGSGPLVKVHQGKLKGIVEDVPGATQEVEVCAENVYEDILRKNSPLVIKVINPFFDALEFGVDPARAASRLTRFLLHELVHWVRTQTKASPRASIPGRMTLDGGYARGEEGEAGELFEKLAYGTSSICNDNEIRDALSSIKRLPI